MNYSDGNCFLYSHIMQSVRPLMSMREKRIWFGMTNVRDDVIVCGGLTEDTWPPPVAPKDTSTVVHCIFIMDIFLTYQ